MTLEMPARKQVCPLRVSATVQNALLVLTVHYFRAHLLRPFCSLYLQEQIKDIIISLAHSGRPISAASLQVPSVQVPQTILVNDYLSCSDCACSLLATAEAYAPLQKLQTLAALILKGIFVQMISIRYTVSAIEQERFARLYVNAMNA